MGHDKTKEGIFRHFSPFFAFCNGSLVTIHEKYEQTRTKPTCVDRIPEINRVRHPVDQNGDHRLQPIDQTTQQAQQHSDDDRRRRNSICLNDQTKITTQNPTIYHVRVTTESGEHTRSNGLVDWSDSTRSTHQHQAPEVSPVRRRLAHVRNGT